MQGWYAAFRTMEPDRFAESSYSIDNGSGPQILEDVQWADWSVTAGCWWQPRRASCSGATEKGERFAGRLISLP